MPIATRAAFDIGSGRTKVLVADVDTAAGILVKIHYGFETSVAYKADVLASGDKQELSAEVQDKGIQTLRELTEKAAMFGASPPYAGVATDVFRKATNGEAFLERVRKELQLNLSLVEQEIEATLGLLTAMALTPAAATTALSNVLAWDSGGGSFQLTNMAAGATVPRSYGGQWGSSVAWSAMIEQVRGHKFSQQTANPVSRAEADKLISLIKEDLAKGEVPPEPWLAELSAGAGTLLVAIGGNTSIFREVQQLTGKASQGLADVREALDSILNKSDDEVVACGLAEEFEYAVPKLCLYAAVLEHFQLPAAHYQEAVGTCAGLLVFDTVMKVCRFWPDGSA